MKHYTLKIRISCDSEETAECVQRGTAEFLNDAPAWIEAGVVVEDLELSED